MKTKFRWLPILLAAALTLLARGSEEDELKTQLVGHCMGGREKCWKFQSREQIKALTIKSKTEGAARRVCVVSLQLQATNSAHRYSAEARVEQVKTSEGWKIKQVGLLSLAKME